MSKAKDTLLRNLALLRLIPNRAPGTTTTVLQEKLRDKGFDISLRSLQRDLNKLSIAFAITCDEDQNARRWYYTSDAAINLPSLDTPSALALQLAEKHLGNLLPQGVMAQLARQFNAARNHLDSLDNNTLARWPNKIRALPNGMVLQPAPVQPQVWEQLSQALVEQRQIQVQYLSRSKGDSKALRLHPLGLVA